MLTDINCCFVACEAAFKEKCRKDIEKCIKRFYTLHHTKIQQKLWCGLHRPLPPRGYG